MINRKPLKKKKKVQETLLRIIRGSERRRRERVSHSFRKMHRRIYFQQSPHESLFRWKFRYMCPTVRIASAILSSDSVNVETQRRASVRCETKFVERQRLSVASAFDQLNVAPFRACSTKKGKKGTFQGSIYESLEGSARVSIWSMAVCA